MGDPVFRSECRRAADRNDLLKHTMLCAGQINLYWAKRGFDAGARVGRGKARNGDALYVVESDLVCGLPTRRLRKAA